jgi:hypothetical protein
MVPLSKRMMETLRQYFQPYRPKVHVFEDEKGVELAFIKHNS